MRELQVLAAAVTSFVSHGKPAQALRGRFRGIPCIIGFNTWDPGLQSALEIGLWRLCDTGALRSRPSAAKEHKGRKKEQKDVKGG
jgi:hypothetical protein